MESVIHNLMIIRADATILKNMAARIGSTASAVRIAHRDLPDPRARWVREDRQVLKVFPASEARSAHKARKAWPALLAHRALSVKQGLLVHKVLPV